MGHVYGNNRFIGLQLLSGEICYLMMNAYFNCLNSDHRTIESLIEYKENLAEIKEKILDEEYDELIKSGDFNRTVFFKEL